jgi:hypothetical protein
VILLKSKCKFWTPSMFICYIMTIKRTLRNSVNMAFSNALFKFWYPCIREIQCVKTDTKVAGNLHKNQRTDTQCFNVWSMLQNLTVTPLQPCPCVPIRQRAEQTHSQFHLICSYSNKPPQLYTTRHITLAFSLQHVAVIQFWGPPPNKTNQMSVH